MHITLVRHGETLNNRSRTVQGQDPTQGRLTEKGLRQAQQLGKRLAGTTFDVAYCSPLERAVLTMAQIIAAQRGERTIPLLFPPELREINLGTLQGKSHLDWKAAITGDPMTWRAPQGESWLDVQARVTDYLARVIVPGGHGRVLIVAHGGVNRGLLASLTGRTMADSWRQAGEGTPQENTCVNALELDAQGRLVSAIANDTQHLAPDPEAGPGQRWLPAQRRWELLGPQNIKGVPDFIPA